MTRPPVGSRVVVTYRAGRIGTVIADNDPRAWTGSIAFAFSGVPTQAQVDAHLAKPQIAKVIAAEIENPRVAVLWDFGSVYWEHAKELYVVRR